MMRLASKEYLVDGKYAIGDLIDLDQLRSVFEKFTRTTGYTIGFLDHPGKNILIATGWRDICTKFHRSSPITAANCKKSNARLLDRLDRPGKIIIEECENGLVDCATPIIIKGKHIASLATGQLLLKPPDQKHFKKRALQCGFSEKEYLTALHEVPVVDAERLKEVTAFLGEIAHIVTELGYASLLARDETMRLEHEASQRKLVEEELGRAMKKYRTLMANAADAILIADRDGHIIESNQRAQQLFGRTAEELASVRYIDLHPPEVHQSIIAAFTSMFAKRSGIITDTLIIGRDGSRIPVDITASVVEYDGLQVCQAFFRDVSDRWRAEEVTGRLAAIARYSSELINIAGLDGRMLFLNDAGGRMLGIDPRALGQTQVTAVIPEHLHGLVHTELLPTIIAGGIWEGDLQYRNLRTGQLTDVHAIAFAIKDPHAGSPTCIANISLDITERKRAEAVSRLAAAQWQSTFDAVKDVVWLLDPDQAIVRTNKAGEEMFGRSQGELVGRRCYEIVHGTSTPLPSCPVVHALKSGRREMVELQLGDQWIEVSADPVLDRESGRISNVVHIIRDITERKRAAEELKTSRDQVQLAIEGSGAGLWDWYIDSGKTVFNERWAEIIGYTLAELEPVSIDTWTRFCHPDDLERSTGLIRRHIAGELPFYECEARMKHKSGRWIWVLDRGRVTERDAQGRAVRMTGTHLDITERKKAEEQAQTRARAMELQSRVLLSLMMEGALVGGDMQYALQRITEACADIIGTERVSIWLYEDNYATIKCIDLYELSRRQHTAGEELQSAAFPAYTHSHQQGKVIAAVDVYRDPRTKDIPHTYYQSHGISSLLDAPVWLHDRIGAVLSFEHIGDHRIWTPEEEGLATTMATLVSLCFESAERKRASDALRDSERKFRELHEHMRDGIGVVDMTKKITSCNNAFIAMLGYRFEELRELSYEDITPACWWPVERKIIDEQVMVRGYSDLFEKEYRRKDGTIFPVELQIYLIRGEGGEPAGMWAFVRDVTERKRAEAAIAASEENYRSIFEAANDAIFVWDAKTHQVIDVNSRACELFRMPRGDIVGRGLDQIIVGEPSYTISHLLSIIKRAEGGEPQLFEWLVTDKSGKRFWIEINMRRVIIAGESRLLSIARDITDRKRLAELKSDFLNMVSHELRTPLAAIKESISQILDGLPGAVNRKQEWLLETSRTNVDRLSRLINNVLDIQKLEAGKALFRLAENDLNKLIGHVQQTMCLPAAKKHLEIRLELEPGLPPVKCDADKVVQILTNLIDNAIKFTETGAVVIRSAAAQGGVQVTVSDTGVGIGKEHMPRLFERFSQEKRKPGGSGLGLALSKQMAEMHGGRIWAESEVGEGSVFYLFLPHNPEQGE